MLVGVETSIGGATGGKKAAHHIIQPRSIRVVIVIYSGLDGLACMPPRYQTEGKG